MEQTSLFRWLLRVYTPLQDSQWTTQQLAKNITNTICPSWIPFIKERMLSTHVALSTRFSKKNGFIIIQIFPAPSWRRLSFHHPGRILQGCLRCGNLCNAIGRDSYHNGLLYLLAGSENLALLECSQGYHRSVLPFLVYKRWGGTLRNQWRQTQRESIQGLLRHAERTLQKVGYW